MTDIGMAGSGAGIASLVLQVGHFAMRLKGFWDAVKGAPEEIKYLIDEIETMSLVLSDFETTNQLDILGHEAVSKCLKFCKKATEVMNSVVTEVETEIKKRKKVGSIKAVLKHDTINKLRQRLMTAQSMLILANNLYLLELQKRSQQAHCQEMQQLRTIVSRYTETIFPSTSLQKPSQQTLTVAETTSTPSKSESHANIAQQIQNCRKYKRHSNRNLKLKALFQTPKWLFGVSRAIEICESRAASGWIFNIQTFNVVSVNSPIMKMARIGDVVGIQQLFSTRQASPFDRDEQGRTVLDWAAGYHAVDVCKLLMNEGADPNVSRHSSALALVCVWQPAVLSYTNFFDLVRLLGEDVELQDPLENVSTWEYFCGDSATFFWILGKSNSTYQQRTLEERVLFALKICRRNLSNLQYDMAGLVRIILKGKGIGESVCCMKDDGNHETLLHQLAYQIGRFQNHLVQLSLSNRGERFEAMLRLLNDLIRGSSDLHALTRNGETPMYEVMDGFFVFYDQKLLRKLTNCGILPGMFGDSMPMKPWLQQLQDSGVNLEEYGREEKRVRENRGGRREFSYCIFDKSGRWTGRESELRLINFTYGPQLDDWKFWFAPVLEDYFKDFWGTIDHPERAMPGAWEEESSDEDDWYD